VMVTAEYNYGYPAALKNAIDYLHHEWRYKPVGFVSYGGVAAGTRAVQQLKQVVGALQLFAVANAVNIPFVPQFLDQDGVIQANDVMIQAAGAMLDELLVVSAALEPLRAGQ
jgi:NAD(P)H-dependent FMN reductase